MSPDDLPTLWRRQAEAYDRDGAIGQASVLKRVANELESSVREQAERVLTLREASLESGLSVDHLGRQVRLGRLVNAGRKGAPRVRAGDVPHKTPKNVATV